MLTEIVNLYCDPCKKVFEKIRHLLTDACKNTVDLQVILLCNYDDPNNVFTKTALHFIAFAEQQPVNQVKEALFDWFEQKDYDLWSKKYPATIEENHLELLKNHVTWFHENKLEGTPISILNNKIVPHIIDIEDLQYLIND